MRESYMGPTARYAGSNSERQGVGLPGHCVRCAEFGHVKAHPDLGCGDVGCNSHHDEEPTPTASVLEEVLAGHVRLTAMDRPFTCACEPDVRDASTSHSAHLAAVLEPYVQQRVGEALEGAAQMLDGIADENRYGGVDLDATVYGAAAREVRVFASVTRGLADAAAGRVSCRDDLTDEAKP